MMLKANQCRTPETPKSFKTLPVLKIVLEKIVKSPESCEDNKDAKGTVYLILRDFAVNYKRMYLHLFNFFLFLIVSVSKTIFAQCKFKWRRERVRRQ